jgi:hypothetical protein
VKQSLCLFCSPFLLSAMTYELLSRHAPCSLLFVDPTTR